MENVEAADMAEETKKSKSSSQEENDEASIAEFYRMITGSLGDVIGGSPMGGYLYNQIRHGKKTVYSKTIRETKVFEKTFIPILNNCFKSISKILKDPKKAIRYEQEVVAMEKVKKVSADTVRHLASHTQFIKQVDENGDVVPSKLLTTFSEDEIGIYENRFIKTLINRICKFLSLRVQIMKKNLDSYETKSTVVTNDFKMEETKVKIEFTVKMERQQDAEVKQARDTFEKAKELQERFKSLRSSQLMQDLKNYKEVTPPILKTNIITKNPEFKVCYSTWIFLDRYNQLAFDVNVREKKNKYPEDQATDVDKLMAETLGTMMYFNGNKDLDEENKPYKEFTTRKAKMLNSMEDEYKFKPDAQKMEQFEMSEYFLNKTQEFYQQSLEDKMNSGMEKKYSLELVFREMQEVVNSIYPPLFEVPVEDEFEDVPLPVKLERAKKKAEVLETITRLKEIDYNNTKKEYEDTLSEIQQTEEKIRQQIAREERLRKLAEEKAERAAKRAAEREEARRIHEELEAKAKAERAKLKAEKDAAKAAEKEAMEATKAKLAERRQKIMAEEQERKAKLKAERDAKKKAREEAEAARIAEQERLEEEERKLEAEKSHLDAKEILRRRREIIKQKAAAAKAREEAERLQAEDADEDDDVIENDEVRAIDEEMARLDSNDSGAVESDVDDDEEEMEETLSPKELLARRREAIRQKALRDASKSAIVDEDVDDEEEKDAKELFREKREAARKAEAEHDAMFDDDNVVSSDSPQEAARPQIQRSQEPLNMFARNRDLIRRRALAAQQATPTNAQSSPQANDSSAEDPKEILRRRREAMRQKSEAAKAESQGATSDSEPQEAVDPRELLRRRREAIRQKALAAQARDKGDE